MVAQLCDVDLFLATVTHPYKRRNDAAFAHLEAWCQQSNSVRSEANLPRSASPGNARPAPSKLRRFRGVNVAARNLAPPNRLGGPGHR